MKALQLIMAVSVALTVGTATAKKSKTAKPQIPILAWYSIPGGQIGRAHV